MTTIDAIILGFVQGVTEFLPVSSSGHLKLLQYFLGMQDLDQYILFDLICHLGTLLAIVIIFSRQIVDLIATNTTCLKQVFLGTLPLFPLVFIMKPIKAIYAEPSYLGFCFMITAAILFLGVYFGRLRPAREQHQHRWRDALAIGAWQAAAILPGVSRSGSTISGARLLGWSPMQAVTFSFLLAIPAILGGTILEGIKLWRHPETVAYLPIAHYITGFIVSFAMGMVSLRLLIRIATHDKFAYFAWYCLFLGLATTAYFHLW